MIAMNILDIDQYIEKFGGVPKARKRLFANRVQNQTVRFGDDLHLHANAPISMLVPLAIPPSRHDDFEGLDDCKIPAADLIPFTQYKERFTECLRKYLICKNLDGNRVYKNANLSQNQWIDIINDKYYSPGKHTAVSIALALHLNMDETMDLLQAAGFELSRDHVFDLIIEYSINNEFYDVLEINEILTEFRQPLLC